MKASISILFLSSICLHSAKASIFSSDDIDWPEYSQQCRDDAGSLFVDDEEIYGKDGFYHDKTAATPVLNNGQCAKPLQYACSVRPTYKAAYLEGPIDCGDQGWYCRIMPDENWPPINLIGDLNFGHCNTTDAFEDAGYDKDGHCHGSSVDSTYYWWIRDHFFRQYNGRLRCCCGWYNGASSEPLYNQRIANRCDYRRLVTKTEDLSQCRDANEEHGLGFDDIGCDPKFQSSQLNKPIPENDDICWELSRFGYTEEEFPTPTPPVPTPTAPVPTPSNEPEECEDSAVKFKIYINDKKRWKDCDWVRASATKSRCNMDDGVAKRFCPDACDTCSPCLDSETKFKFFKRDKRISKDCDWVSAKSTNFRCQFEGVAEACRYTCGLCD